jgi:hypothetical protein
MAANAHLAHLMLVTSVIARSLSSQAFAALDVSRPTRATGATLRSISASYPNRCKIAGVGGWRAGPNRDIPYPA